MTYHTSQPPQDVEKKTHKILGDAKVDERIYSYSGPYPKHDDFTSNPALLLMLNDANNSVLARVLISYSPLFYKLLETEVDKNNYGSWELAPLLNAIKSTASKYPNWNLRRDILPHLLTHLLIGEHRKDFDGTGRLQVATSWSDSQTQPWGIGPENDPQAARELHEAWYQPYRHDIIGDTLSADLLDYLPRDSKSLGLPYELDDHLLDYLVLSPSELPYRTEYNCALDLADYKRGTLRLEAVDDIFSLLNARFAIHHKAVFHRVVQAACAMVWRSIAFLGDRKPALNELYNWPIDAPSHSDGLQVLAGDEQFLNLLIGGQRSSVGDEPDALSIAVKVIERRLYKPLIMITGDMIAQVLDTGEDDLESTIRTLAAIIDSRYYSEFFRLVERGVEALLTHALSYEELAAQSQVGHSFGATDQPQPSKRVIFWALPYKQLYKDPSMKVSIRGEGLLTIEEYARQPEQSDLTSVLASGIGDADAKYRATWKLHVFMSDGLFYRGVLAKIDPSRCGSLDDHASHLNQARIMVIAALRATWTHWMADRKEDAIAWRRTRLNGNSDAVHPLNVDGRSAVLDLMHKMFDANCIENCAAIVGRLGAGIGFSHYLHEQPSDESDFCVSDNCRDVRYKFDRHLSQSEMVSAVEHRLSISGLDGEVAERFLTVFQSVRPVGRLTLLEVEDAVNRYLELTDVDRAAVLPRRVVAERAARGQDKRESEQALISLWRKSCSL